MIWVRARARVRVRAETRAGRVVIDQAMVGREPVGARLARVTVRVRVRARARVRVRAARRRVARAPG